MILDEPAETIGKTLPAGRDERGPRFFLRRFLQEDMAIDRDVELGHVENGRQQARSRAEDFGRIGHLHDLAVAIERVRCRLPRQILAIAVEILLPQRGNPLVC